MRYLMSLALIVFFGTGCQDDKIATLEKQNQDLKAALEKSTATADYDLQGKCSKDARVWFNENWVGTKDAAYLDFTNHYNKSMNKCFILVEYHFTFGESPSWTNAMTLYDVYENSEYASYMENHQTYFKPEYRTEDNVTTCKLGNTECKAMNEFNNLVRPYMSN